MATNTTRVTIPHSDLSNIIRSVTDSLNGTLAIFIQTQPYSLGEKHPDVTTLVKLCQESGSACFLLHLSLIHI